MDLDVVEVEEHQVTDVAHGERREAHVGVYRSVARERVGDKVVAHPVVVQEDAQGQGAPVTLQHRRGAQQWKVLVVHEPDDLAVP